MPDCESKFVSIEAAERPQRGWVGSVGLEARAKPNKTQVQSIASESDP